MQNTIRSFIAIPLPEPIKQTVGGIQNRLKQTLTEVRWVRPESMHLTLHFFGEIDEESLEKAGSVMVSIESLFSPFPLSLIGVGAFPSSDRARVFWMGIKSNKIAALHTELAQRLRGAGLPCEKRPFNPHITLGRCRFGDQKARHILSSEKDTFAGEMTVESLILYESELRPAGAVHRPRRTAYLTAD